MQPEFKPEVVAILDPCMCKSLKQVDYTKMTGPMVMDMLRIRDQQVRLLRAALFTERRETARLTEKLNDPNHALVAKDKPDANSVFAIVQANSRSLAPPGMLAVAVRRNAANIAACRLGSVLLQDMSHQTVVNAELTTDADA